MDSDRHLPSHTAGTEDGISRQAGMLPRRKHAALALRAANWNACTSACAASLAAVTTWLEMHRGTVRAARRSILHVSGRTECSSRVCCRGSLPRAELHRKREDCNHALRGGFSMLLVVRAKQLGAPLDPKAFDTPRRGGNHVPALWDWLCCSTLGTASVLCRGKQANPLLRHTVRVARAAISAVVCTLCARVPLVTGIWMGPSRRMRLNWPSTTLCVAWPVTPAVH
ncbi:hypothetical protein TcBrA4_0118190 [Trypanosoma cruzi]|nr:hypothetical protein TcBrA4_0118190 [Trypanosoma cruzi]